MSDSPALDKTYDPATAEARQYARWEQAGAFACDPGSTAVPYTIMMPPPNVTGSLHMGHALNGTVQDALIRWHRMRGFDALWQPGQDHAGIATQMVVERLLEKEQKTRGDLGRDAFVARVWEWRAESGGTISRQFRRLGASADWARDRFTLDEGLNRAVRKVFVELYRQGLIYKDKRLVNWDPKLGTAVSDLEVEQREVKGKLWYFKYPIEGIENTYITVATTRPETMLGDSAVAVHPQDPRFRDLVGRQVRLPLVGRLIPVIADEYSDPDKGTGAVKITPAHDFNDFEVGRRHGLEAISVLDEAACLIDGEPVPAAYRGLPRFVARERIVADMEALGLLEKVEPHTHAVPHGDRGGVPLEPRLTDQWYCNAAALAKAPIAAVETGKTLLFPKHAEKTFFEWMRNIQPWTISRQLWWGHQIPAWYGPDGQVFVAETQAEAQSLADAHYGSPVTITRDPDVLDTWFSSALWPFSTLGWPDPAPEVARYYPGDVLVTGFDILFFWVARMMMMGCHFMGDVPFRHVFLHTLVRDAKGQKMSKTRGNVIDPLVLIDRYGADALRFSLASYASLNRINFSEKHVESSRNFVTKLWNAARFAAMNGCRPDTGFDPAACRLTVTRWIIGEVDALRRTLDAAFAEYRFNDATAALHQFIWGSFCDWYLELVKPLFQAGGEAAAEARAATAWVLDRILVLLHPICPFVTEELFERLGERQGALLIRHPWPAEPAPLADPAAAAEIGWLVSFVSAIRSVRADMNVPAATAVTLQVKDAGEATAAWLARHREVILRLARAADIVSVAGFGPGTAQVVVGEATIGLPLEGVIDLAAERARLAKEITRCTAEIAKVDARMGNAEFMAKAPEEVVAENQERRAEFAAARERYTAALARLG